MTSGVEEGPLLSGIRVLDLTQMLAGPFGTMLLADMGCDVIKIEVPGRGDMTRDIGPHFIKGLSAYFMSINRNKRSVCLDLKKESAREVFYDLVRHADVVVDNFRPGVMERLGCDHDALARIQPRIITCSLSGFGSTGPYRDRPAFDLALQAMSGVMSYTGEEGRPPVRMGVPMGDLAGGIYLSLAVSAALARRERTGRGARIEVPLLDALVSLHTYVAQFYLVSGDVPRPIGSAHQSVVPYQAFRASDSYFVVAVYTEKFWEALCRVIGREDLIRDPRFATNADRAANRGTLVPLLEGIFLKRSAEEWLERLSGAGVPCAPIYTLDRLFSDEHVRSSGLLVDMDVEGVSLRSVGCPLRVAGSAPTYRRAPYLGEHTREVLKGVLGYPEERIEELECEGAIHPGERRA